MVFVWLLAVHVPVMAQTRDKHLGQTETVKPDALQAARPQLSPPRRTSSKESQRGRPASAQATEPGPQGTASDAATEGAVDPRTPWERGYDAQAEAKAVALKAEQAEAAAKAKAEAAAQAEGKRLASMEAARVASENASELKAEQAEAAARAKAEAAVRVEAKRMATEESARAASEKARLKSEQAEAAAKAKAEAAANREADRLAKEDAERQAALAAATAAKEKQARDQAALIAYAEAAAPEDSGTVSAVLGSGLILNWPDASRRIAIADETIASFTVVSPREIVVNGIKPGRTTVFVWLASGRRLFYRILVEHNFGPARAALRELNPALVLESGPDGDSVVLRGEVANEVAARQAKSLVEQLLPRGGDGAKGSLQLVNLIRYAGVVGTPEDRLAAAMSTIDARIKVRRIQSGAESDPAKDSYFLEGSVRDVNALVQAVVLADRQLGGTGKTVKAADDDRVTFNRAGGGSGGAVQGLQPGEPSKAGIAIQVARGLLITSESGRVVSFLKVDFLPQVMVAIRVLEVDRNKARRMGLDMRLDGKQFSAAHATIPGGGPLPDLRGGVTALAGSGNLVGSYVDKTISAIAALDFMTEKQVARSVAEPNILTMSGEQASVLVGGEVPIPTTSSTAVSSSAGFFFQQFGVRLDIRPTVSDGGLVTLEVAPSIVTPSAGLGNGSVPGFRIQRVETTARVQAGESLVLGGLLSSNESVEERGLPLLGKVIPLLRWQRKSLENTELVFLITPKIVVPPSVPVRLPPLEFPDNPTTSIGKTGLDEAGVPFSFKAAEATVGGHSDSCVEVRARPDQEAVLVDCVVPGAAVLVLEEKGVWRRIQVPKGADGWVRRDHIDLKKP